MTHKQNIERKNARWVGVGNVCFDITELREMHLVDEVITLAFRNVDRQTNLCFENKEIAAAAQQELIQLACESPE